jgi:hypothetical protein
MRVFELLSGLTENEITPELAGPGAPLSPAAMSPAGPMPQGSAPQEPPETAPPQPQPAAAPMQQAPSQIGNIPSAPARPNDPSQLQ